MQHLHSGGKLLHYVFVPSQRRDNHDESTHLPIIFCVVFRLGMISATSNKNSNSWIDCNNIYLSLEPDNFRIVLVVQVLSTLSFCSATLECWLFVHMYVSMWSYSHFHVQDTRKEGATVACLRSKSFWGEGEETK